MTIASLTSQIQSPCNGVTTQFAFGNKIFLAADLIATLIDTLGNLYPFTLTGFNTFSNAATGLSYTVNNIDVDAGCFIAFNVAPTNGWTLDLRTAIAELQPTSIKNQGSFLPELHEEFFDKATRMLQDLYRKTYTFGIHGPDIENTPWTQLPSAAQRASTQLLFDNNGLPTVGIQSPTTVTGAIIANLLNQITAIAPTADKVRTAAETTAGIVPTNFSIPSHATGFVLPERYGAVGNGNSSDLVNAALDTAAINNAITIASATGCPIVLSRHYIAIPGTAQAGAANYNCAFALKSGVTFLGQSGGSIKMQDGYSTNGAPKEMAMFSTVASLSNITWLNLLMDMNGANNLMSPARPVTYNRFNHAAIMANGPTGILSDIRIEDCTFQNTAGVCYVVAQLVAAGTTPAMGVRWTVRNNLFLNGGSDTDDLTGFFGWAEEVIFDGNTLWQDNPPHTVGLTGGASGFEVHGARGRYVNNVVRNYKNGGYVSSNFTNKTVDVVVANNQFYTSDYGLLFYRQQVGNQTEIDNVIIANNNFYFDATTTLPLWSDGNATRVCIGFEGGYSTFQLAVNNIKISGNLAIDNSFGSTSLLSCFVRWDSCQNVANQVCSNLSITDNEVIGFTEGVTIFCVTNAASNGQGFTEISNNKFISFSPDTGGLYDVVGIKVNATNGVTTLVIDGNQYIDERGVPKFLRGILLQGAGTITDLSYGIETFKGLTGQLYLETAVTVTNRKGVWVTRGVTGAVPTGTATGHGLPAAPTQVMLQQLDGVPTGVFSGTFTATQFTINFAGGGNHAFAWQASIGNPFP